MRHRSIGILLSTGLQELFRDDLGHLATPSWAALPREDQKGVDSLGTSPSCSSRMAPRSWTSHRSSQPALQSHPKAPLGPDGLVPQVMRGVEPAPCLHTGCAGTHVAPCPAARLQKAPKARSRNRASTASGSGCWSCSPGQAQEPHPILLLLSRGAL